MVVRGVGDESVQLGAIGRNLDLVAGDGRRRRRIVLVVPLAVAVRPVGAPGTVVAVVALSTLEAAPVPTELIAETR